MAENSHIRLNLAVVSVGRNELRLRLWATVELSLSPISGLDPHRHLYGGIYLYRIIRWNLENWRYMKYTNSLLFGEGNPPGGKWQRWELTIHRDNRYYRLKSAIPPAYYFAHHRRGPEIVKNKLRGLYLPALHQVTNRTII